MEEQIKVVTLTDAAEKVRMTFRGAAKVVAGELDMKLKDLTSAIKAFLGKPENGFQAHIIYSKDPSIGMEKLLARKDAGFAAFKILYNFRDDVTCGIQRVGVNKGEDTVFALHIRKQKYTSIVDDKPCEKEKLEMMFAAGKTRLRACSGRMENYRATSMRYNSEQKKPAP